MEANVVVHNGPRIFMKSNLIFFITTVGTAEVSTTKNPWFYLVHGYLCMDSLGIAFNQGLG